MQNMKLVAMYRKESDVRFVMQRKKMEKGINSVCPRGVEDKSIFPKTFGWTARSCHSMPQREDGAAEIFKCQMLEHCPGGMPGQCAGGRVGVPCPDCPPGESREYAEILTQTFPNRSFLLCNKSFWRIGSQCWEIRYIMDW